MVSATMTFDECKNAVDRMFAYAVLMSQAAHHFVKSLIFLLQVEKSLGSLLSILSADTIELLTGEQRDYLLVRLQEAHLLLVGSLSSKETQSVADFPLKIVSGRVKKLLNGTIDLGDRIENIILMGDRDFLQLVGACAVSLGLDRRADQIAGMQG